MKDYKNYIESLIYYTLRDKEGNYFDPNSSDKKSGLGMCFRFRSIDSAKDCQKINPGFSEIRKIKIFDMGEINEG